MNVLLIFNILHVKLSSRIALIKDFGIDSETDERM